MKLNLVPNNYYIVPYKNLLESNNLKLCSYFCLALDDSELK